MAFLWGPIGDKFGRVRTLMITILWYSVFTFLSAFAVNVWQLAILRPAGGYRNWRRMGDGRHFRRGGVAGRPRASEGAGYMHTGYYVGFFLAALANYRIGSHFGWRAMFAFGGLPALLLAWIRHGVHEPERWSRRKKWFTPGHWWRPLATLFNPTLAPPHDSEFPVHAGFDLRLWAGTVYVPSAVTALAEASGPGWTGRRRNLASYATMLVAVRYHSRLLRHAKSGGTLRTPRSAWPSSLR